MTMGASTTVGDADDDVTSVPIIEAAFFLEQHLGHRTYAENLMSAAPRVPGVRPVWIPIRYEVTGQRDRSVLPAPLRAVHNARLEMLSGLRGRDPDIHVFNTQIPAVIGPRAVRSRPYILITDVTPVQYDQMAAAYEHHADRRGARRLVKRRWNRHVFGRAAAVVTWSAWARDSVVADYGVEPARTAVIPPGVDLERWSPGPTAPDGRPKILFVGGDFYRKGGDDLLAAFATLPAGTAELIVVTRSDVARSDGVEVIKGLGPNDDRLVDLYRRSDIFALPSSAETFGIAAVEASACGLPVVASRSGGLADIVVDGETGLLIESGNRDQLAAALRRLVDDRSLRTSLGAQARRRAATRFDSDANARQLFELIRMCASR
jgi:glycosyltransferase involved in cell wall biosynthesis